MNAKESFVNFQLVSIAACSPKQVADYFQTNREFHLKTSPLRSDLYFTEMYWQKAIPIHLTEMEAGTSQRFFILNEKQRLVGNISFTNIQGFPIHACNLGYSLDKDFTGRGLMNHFLAVAIEFIFAKTEVHKIFANHTPWNVSSAKVLKRLGFEKIGECKDYLLINDNWEDHILNVLIKK
ncbi:MAG: GNAT family N-acetyltransferase [Oligoflexia bacterium]|nr:GNAT family N-acetyltransferase [Oligoflexia bacterium]